MTSEEKIRRMMEEVAEARKKFEKPFKEKLLVVTSFLFEKVDALRLLGIEQYSLPVGKEGREFGYDVNKRGVYYEKTGVLLDDAPTGVQEDFVTIVLKNWDSVKQAINADIDRKLDSKIYSCQQTINAYEKWTNELEALEIEEDEELDR